MRRRLTLLVVTLMACSGDESPEASCPPERLSPQQVCLPEPCADGEVRIDGACTRVGNLVCAEGFVADRAGGCVASLPSKCSEPLVAFPGDSECHPLDACSSERFAPATEPALYVDADAMPGGDGSVDKPLRSIGDALTRSRTTSIKTVLLAAGTYVERLVVDAPVTLRGICSEKTVLAPPRSADGQSTVTVAADATVSGMSIVGAPHLRAFSVVGGASLSLQSIRIRGHLSAIEAERVSTPKVPRLRLDGVSIADAAQGVSSMIPFEIGRIHIVGAVEAIHAEADGTVEAAVIEDGSDTGVTIRGGRVDIRRSVVRRLAGAEAGSRGIQVDKPSGAGASEARVVSSMLSDIEGSALSVMAGHLFVDETSIRDGHRPKNGQAAAGIALAESGVLDVRNTTVLRPSFAGILSFGSTLTVQRTLVRDVSADGFGSGIAVSWGKTLGEHQLTGVLVERATGAGIYVLGADATITDARIRDVSPNAAGLFGDGISVGRAKTVTARVIAHRISVERAARAAVSVFAAELSLGESRLCGAFVLEGSEASPDGARGAFSIGDEGGNACGCGGPLRKCKASQSGLEPIPPPL